jgi:hypothetical protein
MLMRRLIQISLNFWEGSPDKEIDCFWREGGGLERDGGGGRGRSRENGLPLNHRLLRSPYNSRSRDTSEERGREGGFR